MAGTRKTPAKKTAKTEPELVYEDGYWWIVAGTKRLNVGRNERYAQRFMAEHYA